MLWLEIAGLIVIATALIGVVLTLRRRVVDPGFVSPRWVAEHRVESH